MSDLGSPTPPTPGARNTKKDLSATGSQSSFKKPSQKAQKAAEEARLKKEKAQKLDEHKQRVKAIEQSDYNAFDESRAKAADELMWLDFETRMRELIKQMVSPALQLSLDDRNNTLEHDVILQKLNTRVNLLERATFKLDPEEETQDTIFDVYETRISEMKSQLQAETR